MINLEEKIKNNEDLIRKYTLDQWIALLKHICISCIRIPSKKEIESIMNANSFKVEYAEGRIIKIELYTNDLCWEDFKMELNILLDRKDITHLNKLHLFLLKCLKY